jgi:hypothetical protein
MSAHNTYRLILKSGHSQQPAFSFHQKPTVLGNLVHRIRHSAEILHPRMDRPQPRADNDGGGNADSDVDEALPREAERGLAAAEVEVLDENHG